LTYCTSCINKPNLMDLHYTKRIGIKAAYIGAAVLRSFFGKITRIEKKGPADLVTEADTASEKAIIETISTVFPDHGILAEEGGLRENGRRHQWIVDPLDGTTNFAHQVPLFSVSIALSIDRQIVFGIVLNPITGELFTADRGAGARLNDRPIRVSETELITDSLLATGFPYDRRDGMDRLMTRFRRCLTASRGIRRLGSAALDLCFVACGRFDGYWEKGLKPWDVAAGALIAQEAGGWVTDFAGAPYNLDSGEILATNNRIHTEMLQLLA